MSNPTTIATANYNEAIDQAHEYDSLREALDSYLGNAGDTAIAQGADWNETCSIFCKLVNDNHSELNF